jgi:hypothetical protein
MFVREDYRDRALGLAGAFGLLIVGILVNRGQPVPVKAGDATQAVNHVVAEYQRPDVVC